MNHMETLATAHVVGDKKVISDISAWKKNPNKYSALPHLTLSFTPLLS